MKVQPFFPSACRLFWGRTAPPTAMFRVATAKEIQALLQAETGKVSALRVRAASVGKVRCVHSKSVAVCSCSQCGCRPCVACAGASMSVVVMCLVLVLAAGGAAWKATRPGFLPAWRVVVGVETGSSACLSPADWRRPPTAPSAHRPDGDIRGWAAVTDSLD